MITLLVALLAAQQVPVAPAPAPAPAPQRRPAATSTTIEVRVTDRSGAPTAGAHVTAEGPSSRDGITDAAGTVTLRTLAFGTYRVRADHDGSISLEKELTLRTAPSSRLEFALSAAPEPPTPVEPPPPPPAPVAVAPPVLPGKPVMLSLADLAENSLDGRDPLRTVPIGCSGLSRAQLLVVRESLPATSTDDADTMLYVIAGEGSLAVADKTQTISSGWFSLVPRGTTRTVTRRGRNPLLLLSIVDGPPCVAAGQ
jgi:hypothetical protein